MKSRKPENHFRGRYFLPIVLLIYGLLYTLEPEKTLLALHSSRTILVQLLPVFLIVIILMAILSSLLKSKIKSRNPARKPGVKNWAMAVLGGILSHGSSYIWYPLLADLRKNQVKDSLIITFLYARSIKLPWLPLMVSYFGTTYTLILTLYIIIGAVIQGLLAEKMMTCKTHVK